MFVRCSNWSWHSRGGTPKHTQTFIDATQKETAIDQQQHSCETLICQRHQTILRFLPSAATASTRWRVREIYCPITYAPCRQLLLRTVSEIGRTDRWTEISVHLSVRSPPAYCSAVYRGWRYQRLWWYNLFSWGWAACCSKHVEDRSVTYILLKKKWIVH